MSTTNKRALVTAAKQPLLIEEKPIHDTPPAGLVIKTHYSGICHSDVHLWEDQMAISETTDVPVNKFGYPILLGHEISGEVFSVGSEVKSDAVKVGDRVIVFAWAGCKACGVCAAGVENVCQIGQGTNVGCSAKTEGGYQSYVKLDSASDVVKLPDNMPMASSCLLACSGLTAYSAVCKIKEVIEQFSTYNGRSSLLVIGAGGLGQWAIQIAKAVLPETCRVYVADISEEKVASGKKAGADSTLIWPLSDSIPEISKSSMEQCPGGFNAVIDFVNNPKTIGVSVNVTAKGAVLAQVGLFGGSGHTIPLFMVPLKMATIAGVFTGSYAQLVELVNLVSTHKIKSPELTKVPLEEAFDALMRLREGKVAGRTVIDFVNV